MTNEDIIRIAREANLLQVEFSTAIQEMWVSQLKRFANLIAAEEREACAKVCDENTNPNADKYAPVGQYEGGCYITAEYLAAAIRARGQ